MHLFSSSDIWMPRKAAPVAESARSADKFASGLFRARVVVAMNVNMINLVWRRGNRPHPRSIDAAEVNPSIYTQKLDHLTLSAAGSGKDRRDGEKDDWDQRHGRGRGNHRNVERRDDVVVSRSR